MHFPSFTVKKELFTLSIAIQIYVNLNEGTGQRQGSMIQDKEVMRTFIKTTAVPLGTN